MTVRKSRRVSAAKRHAQIEKISIVGVEGRMGLLGLWMYAAAYLRAGRAVPPPDAPYEPMRYVLVCHSIELALKSFLSVQGATMLQLADNAYGHNLVTILATAEGQGLLGAVPLSDAQRAEIRNASDTMLGKYSNTRRSANQCAQILAYPTLKYYSRQQIVSLKLSSGHARQHSAGGAA